MSEINEKEIKRRFESISKFEISPEVTARDLEQTKQSLTKLTSEQQKSEQNIWRIIMKSNITKLAAAVIILGLVLVGITLLEKTTTPAYAVEQTVEAIRNITSVHFFINTFSGDRIEMWLKVNPETGENEKFYIEGPEFKGTGTLNDSYMFMKKTNTVIHVTGQSNIIQFGQFIEEMVETAKSDNGTIQIKSEKIKGGKSVILLTIETDDYKMESRVNPVTKLPISIQLIPKKELAPGNIGQSMEDFSFNEPLPEGIFNFEIPEGATVEEQ